MICGHAQIVGLAPSLGAPSMTSYSLGLPALWPDDSIGMDTPSPGDPAVSAALRTYHCSPGRSERPRLRSHQQRPRSGWRERRRCKDMTKQRLCRRLQCLPRPPPPSTGKPMPQDLDKPPPRSLGRPAPSAPDSSAPWHSTRTAPLRLSQPVRLQLLFRRAGCCRIRMVRVAQRVRVGGVVER